MMDEQTKKRLRKSAVALHWDESPANGLKELMWQYLMDGGQEFDDQNIDDLKCLVYELVQITTQKASGIDVSHYRNGAPVINSRVLDMLTWQIVCEATALVLSGRLDELRKSEVTGS